MKSSVARWARLLLAETTSGVPLVFGAATVLAALLLALVADTSLLVPGLADPLNVALAATFVIGPLMAAGASVRGGSLARQGFLDLARTTPRGCFRLLLLTSVAFGFWSVLAYLVFAIVTIVDVGAGGPRTAPMLTLILRAVVVLGFLVVLGTAMGVALRTGLIGPVLAFAILLGFNLIDLNQGWLGRLSPIDAGTFYRYGFEPNALLSVAVSLFYAACASLVVAWGFGAKVGVKGLLTGVAVGLFALAGLSFSEAPPGDVSVRSGSSGECLSRDGVTLCVWPGPDAPIEASLSALVDMRSLAAPLFPVPRYFYEPGLDPVGTPAREYLVPTPRDAREAGYEAFRAMVPKPCDAPSSRAANDLLGLVGELRKPGSIDPDGPAAAGIEVAGLSQAAQREWATPRIQELERCD